jgi:serine/threonine protein kinase
MPDGPGERLAQIGEYTVVRYLTAGGMADLYLVRRPPARELLVVKRVQSRYLRDERVVALFHDEGRIGALLDHPNIVRFVKFGEADGHPYIVMEYIPGHDLVETLRLCTARQAVFPRELGVMLCEKVARGLAYAHDLLDEKRRPVEVVHCDVSPGNVMISYRGLVKLVDFGVARARIPLECRERGVAGKYNYMAPEQIRGGPVDRRADLFSLGVILYEVTCGRRLFRGRPEAVLRQVMEEPIPPPHEVCPGYPRELSATVMRALERDPARRYQTAEALRVDLNAYLRTCPRPHGRHDLARLLRTLSDHPDPALSDLGEEDARETVDLAEVMPQLWQHLDRKRAAVEDLTTETPAPFTLRIDDEEALLTRHDSPLLSDEAARIAPLPRDPERTGLLLPPDRRRRRHLSGGITTHMLGDGATHRLADSRPERERGTRHVPQPEATAAVRPGRRWDPGMFALIALCLLLLIFVIYLAQR